MAVVGRGEAVDQGSVLWGARAPARLVRPGLRMR